MRKNLFLKILKKYKSLICDKFSSIIEWNEFNIENKIKEVIEYYQIDFKSIGQPLRLLITGSLFGPSLSKIIKVLGLQKQLKESIDNFLIMKKKTLTIKDNRNGKVYEFDVKDGSCGPAVADLSSFLRENRYVCIRSWL